MKKISKILSFVMILTLLCSGFAFADTDSATPAAVPADVAGTASENAVEALMNAGAITGDDDGLYHPTDNLTRAQACIIIVKTIDPEAALVNGTATQLPKGTGFSDMKGYSWAENYIAYAVNQGIVKGYPDGTFKPGSNVKTEDMAVMLVRAAKLAEDESTMTYPTDYMTLAESKGIFEGIDKPYPELATKAMAAQMDYAVMAELKAAAPVVDNSDTPQGTDKDTAETVPSANDMTFTTGTFDGAMSTFAGKTISGNATIYTYGQTKDYAADMKLSTKKSDYREDTVYKFKNVKTPAWYKAEDNKITEMILPMDAGFSGKVYGVITGTCTVLNAAGERVTGIETLTALQPVTWFCKQGLAPIPAESAYNDGLLYELSTSDGEVRTISISTDASKKNENFKELTPSNTWGDITEYDNGVVKLSDGTLISMADNATVYVWDADDREYKQGRLSSIREGKKIRAYQLSDDDGELASVAVIKD